MVFSLSIISILPSGHRTRIPILNRKLASVCELRSGPDLEYLLNNLGQQD